MSNVKDRVRQRRQQGNGGGEQAPARRSELDVKVDKARHMFGRMQDEFAAALPKHVGIDRFMRMAVTCMRKNPALLDCDPPSVLAALLEAA
ncbi:hypothetical protein ACFQ07_00770, partial [Actinomadura adrarensis]